MGNQGGDPVHAAHSLPGRPALSRNVEPGKSTGRQVLDEVRPPGFSAGTQTTTAATRPRPSVPGRYRVPPPGCFPSESKVKLNNGNFVTMSELQIGDEVQTGISSYNTVRIQFEVLTTLPFFFL